MNCPNCGKRLIKLIGEDGKMCKECFCIKRSDGTIDKSEMRVRVKRK